MSFDKTREVLKFVLTPLAGIGAANVTSTAVSQYVPPKGTSPIYRVPALVGTYAISGIVGAAAAKYAEQTVDETFDLIENLSGKSNKKS